MKANLFIRFESMEHAYQNYMDYCAHEGLSVMSSEQFEESCAASVKVYLSAIKSWLDMCEIKYNKHSDGDGFWDYVFFLDLDQAGLEIVLESVNSEIFTHSTDKMLHYTFRSIYDFDIAHDRSILFAIKPILLELDVEQHE